MGIVTRLNQLGYSEVFTDKKEDIAYEVRQRDLQIERENARIMREEQGWCYKIIKKEDSSESQIFGPFSQDEMEQWNEGGFFKESDEQFCTFIKSKEYSMKRDTWVFIDDIKTFRY